ncbi:MAG: phosphate signaling complex protein PhoU [Rhodospirillales bacterium]
MTENNKHIVKEFDSELRRLDNLIAELGGLAERQLADSIDALVRRNAERAQEIVSADERLDDLERQIDHLGIDMLIRRQPMANDLRLVIAALKTASILERIGDYAKNIAKRTVALSQLPNVGSVRSVVRMADRTQTQIKVALDAYLNRDPDLAEDVRASDQEIDSLHTSLFRELLTYMMEDPRNITACTHLLFVAKNLERMGDHATSVAENLLFLVHGASPVDARPKRDAAHYTVIEPKNNESE